MLSGELYMANDPELISIRDKARKLFRKFNTLDDHDREAKEDILRQLLGSTGENIDIQAPFHCDYGIHIHAGKNLFINFGCVILDCAKVSIGDNVMFAPNVQIYAAHHPVIAAERIKGPELASPVTIGNNVWIGGGVIICPGVSIGDNTTIGAGSIVTKNIPANGVGAGTPCRVIREL